jgi:hypothetical protein
MNNEHILIYFNDIGEITKVINEENGQHCTFDCVNEVEE